MAELASRERLQPSLLDRLTDDEPDKSVESRDRRVMSIRTLREGVIRDLAWLLNTTNLFSVADRYGLPHVANSVINFGIPDISGITISSMNLGSLERAIRQAIWDFEPRLIRGSVAVKAHSDQECVNTVLFDIEADMWAQPYPERLYLKTELDIDSASIRLTDMTGKRQ